MCNLPIQENLEGILVMFPQVDDSKALGKSKGGHISKDLTIKWTGDSQKRAVKCWVCYVKKRYIWRAKSGKDIFRYTLEHWISCQGTKGRPRMHKRPNNRTYCDSSHNVKSFHGNDKFHQNIKTSWPPCPNPAFSHSCCDYKN